MPHSPTSLRAARLPLIGLSAVFLFEMLDNSVLNVALPTIGRELSSSTTALQWVTSSYSVVFGGLMLAFSALADRIGRRKIMLVGLSLLAIASVSTVLVTSVEQLIAVRAAMGVAAAMTTPGSLALAFRLFDDEQLRLRAATLVSTVGLVGLAVGPTVGGVVLSFAPWQALLLFNTPIAVLAFLSIHRGIPRDRTDELHDAPIDALGALLGTATTILAFLTPTFFIDNGIGSALPWTAGASAVVSAVLFVARLRSAEHPILDIALIARPLVSSGLALKSAASLATAGLGYLVTLQLQLDLGWSAAQASLGMLPQVVVLIGGGAAIGPLTKRLGLNRTAWFCAVAVVCGLIVYTVFGGMNYVFIALALAMVAAGMRVGVVAGNNVMRGLPPNRTTIGAALVDTASELTTSLGIALSGSIIAIIFTGSITSQHWSPAQTDQFRDSITIAAATLTLISAGLVAWGIARSRNGSKDQTEDSSTTV